jgi:hypothetical protein
MGMGRAIASSGGIMCLKVGDRVIIKENWDDKYFKIGFGKITEVGRNSNTFQVKFDDNIRKIVPFIGTQIRERNQIAIEHPVQWRWKSEIIRSIILCA